MKRINKNTFGPWALVTGASSGIGKEFARQLAASGLNLVLVARRLPFLEEIGCTLAGEYGIDYRAIGLDLSQEDFLGRLETATRDLEIGLVVSNVGTVHLGEFLSFDQSLLHQMVRLSVSAHLDLAYHFGGRLAARKRGGIILLSGMGASQGVPYTANDSATRAYVLTLGETLNVEWRQASGERDGPHARPNGDPPILQDGPGCQEHALKAHDRSTMRFRRACRAQCEPSVASRRSNEPADESPAATGAIP